MFFYPRKFTYNNIFRNLYILIYYNDTFFSPNACFKLFFSQITFHNHLSITTSNFSFRDSFTNRNFIPKSFLSIHQNVILIVLPKIHTSIFRYSKGKFHSLRLARAIFFLSVSFLHSRSLNLPFLQPVFVPYSLICAISASL